MKKLLFLLATGLLISCGSPEKKPTPPPVTTDTIKEKPETHGDSMGKAKGKLSMSVTATPTITSTLAATTPSYDNTTVAASGDTLVLTRFWTPAKGSGTWMLLSGGQNGTGGVAGIPDSSPGLPRGTFPYTAGKASLRLPHARPAPGSSTSLWACQTAATATAKGSAICNSHTYTEPIVNVPPVTPPIDSTPISVIVPGDPFYVKGTYTLKTTAPDQLVYSSATLHTTITPKLHDCRYPAFIDSLTGVFTTGCRRYSDDAHLQVQMCMGIDLGTKAVWASQSKANQRCASAAPRLAAEFGARWDPTASDTGWVFIPVPPLTVGYRNSILRQISGS